MLFFVILFFLNCSASNGPLYIYEGQEKAYFFDAPLIQKQINYLNGFTIKKAETFKLPDQKYDLIFNSFQSIFEWDFKSLCVVYFKKIQRIFICDNFEKNIKKILDHKNFKNNGTEVEITIKCTKHMNIPLCQLILKMCFADSFVTIQLNDKMIQYINEQNITWTPDLITLDRGLMPLFDTLRKTKRLNDIIKNFKKSNNSKLSFYEKILTFFDPGYLSAKRFFGDDAFGFTIRHSKTFRKRVISLMAILFFGIPFSFFCKNYF